MGPHDRVTAIRVPRVCYPRKPCVIPGGRETGVNTECTGHGGGSWGSQGTWAGEHLVRTAEQASRANARRLAVPRSEVNSPGRSEEGHTIQRLPFVSFSFRRGLADARCQSPGHGVVTHLLPALPCAPRGRGSHLSPLSLSLSRCHGLRSLAAPSSPRRPQARSLACSRLPLAARRAHTVRGRSEASGGFLQNPGRRWSGVRPG